MVVSAWMDHVIVRSDIPDLIAVSKKHLTKWKSGPLKSQIFPKTMKVPHGILPMAPIFILDYMKGNYPWRNL
jgi:hypothetical protein